MMLYFWRVNKMALQRQGTDKFDAYETTSSSTHYGKGSITRPYNHKKYAENWDKIFNKKANLGLPDNSHLVHENI